MVFQRGYAAMANYPIDRCCSPRLAWKSPRSTPTIAPMTSPCRLLIVGVLVFGLLFTFHHRFFG